MDKQFKKILIYALSLFLAAAVLITISAIAQNRITKEREEELKSDLTTDITQRLEQTMQKNIDQINEENTYLKTQLAEKEKELSELKNDIESLRSELSTLNGILTEKDQIIAGLKMNESRMEEMKTDIQNAVDYYKAKKDAKAETIIRDLAKKIDSWAEEDAASSTGKE